MSSRIVEKLRQFPYRSLGTFKNSQTFITFQLKTALLLLKVCLFTKARTNLPNNDG